VCLPPHALTCRHFEPEAAGALYKSFFPKFPPSTDPSLSVRTLLVALLLLYSYYLGKKILVVLAGG